MNIFIKSIPHKKQRYDTCGDYFWDKRGIEQIRVSVMEPDYEFLVAVHELVEWYLTKKRGIKEDDITKFDKSFKGKGEAGNNKKAPYHKEHRFATAIEVMVANELRIDWKEYEETLKNL